MAFGGSKVIEYIIRAKDATASAVKSAKASLSGLGDFFLENAANIKAAMEMCATAVKAMWAGLQKAIQFEKMTYQFKTLTGSLDEARAHMRMLQEMGDTPPFSLEEFAKASRSLMVMTDGVLGYKKSLELVGDAAAATGQPVEQLAHEVGKAYAVIRDGQPLSRATMALRNMGAITPDVCAELEKMQEAGASNFEIWQKLTDSLGKFKGAMADTEETADGLMGAIQSQWDDAVRSLGGAFLEAAKGGMETLLKYMRKLQEDGTIEVWAKRGADALDSLIDKLSAIKEVGGFLWNDSGLSDVWHGAVGSVKGVGALIGGAAGGISEGLGVKGTLGTMTAAFNEAVTEEMAKGKYGKMFLSTAAGRFMYGGAADTALVNSAKDERREMTYRQQIVAEKARKAAEAEAEAQRKADEEELRIKAQMEEAQAKQQAETEERLAKEAAEKEAAETAKRIELEERERKRMLNELERERERLAEQAYRKEVDLARDALDESQASQAAAQSRLAQAQSQVARAWGWYRDRDSMQAHIDDVLEQREAEKQWKTDFERLKSSHRDWRSIDIGKLSAEEEATRQVALAKEAEEQAKKDLAEIAENTRDLAEKLDELMAMKED